MEETSAYRWAAHMGDTLSRRMLGGFAAGALILCGLSGETDAKKKKKKKKKCVPQCAGRNCGSNGCGGTCGSCGGGTACTGGQCSTYRFVAKWGSRGSGQGQFYIPGHIAVDAANHLVYVTDPLRERIQVFDTSGTFVKTLTFGDDSPGGIAVDADGNVYVATVDTPETDAITKLDNDGDVITTWGSGLAGRFAPGEVAARGAGQQVAVYVSEQLQTRIQKFNGDGDYVTDWGSFGTGDGQFSGVDGIAADASGNVFVLESNGHRVQKFTSAGQFDAKWGTRGAGPTQFEFPLGIAADAAGDVFVADGVNSRVLKFDGNGNPLTRWGAEGSGDGEFERASGVAVDGDGNVYVLDGTAQSGIVQKFAPVNGAGRVAAQSGVADWSGGTRRGERKLRQRR